MPKTRTMRCHYCDRPAAVEVTSDGVVVGVCQRHLRERVAALAEEAGLSSLRERLDLGES